ncbi:MAG: glucose-6-phosphate isomerase family protein [Candidatus Paceibacterota bacterium]
MNKNILKTSGLPIKLTKNGLVFSKNTSNYSFESKGYFQYKEFFQNQGLAKDKKLYYIYRNACTRKDQPLFEKEGLRYDLTLIFPGKIGRETIRTIGHFHKSTIKKKFREEYQVISGNALFILQNIKTKKTFIIPRKERQRVFIPKGFGHITANASDKNSLLIANIFSNQPNISDYSSFKKHHGPSWYPVLKGNKIVFERNPNYKSFPKPESRIPKRFTPSKTSSLYKEFVKSPKKFHFLEI